MIKYYPLTRIKPNQYTRGGEYTRSDGSTYTGRYYLTYDGAAYAGINPVLGTNEPLTSIKRAEALAVAGYVSPGQRKIAIVGDMGSNTADNAAKLTQLQPYYPLPTSADYARGYFTRFFAKSVSGPGYVIEISQGDWAQLENGTVSPTTLGYEYTSMLWQLTGPEKDTRVSQYQIKGGVYDTNKRVTEAKATGFVGLLAFIGGEYLKFAKITP